VSGRSQRLRTSTLPFEYDDRGLSFELDSYTVDGGTETELDLVSGQTWFEPDEEWSRLTLRGQIDVSDELVESVLPAGERSTPPARLYVAVRCRETIYRDRVDIKDEPVEPGTYRFETELERRDLRGVVTFHPYLSRTSEAESNADGVATAANARLAGARTYTLVVDPEPEEPSTIDGEEVSFSEHDHLPNDDRLYLLDLRNEARPKLWVNADHPRITDVLQSRGSVGAEPRMRDVVLDQIGYGVWTQLVAHVATAVDEDGNLEHEWQETVVKILARDMYDTDDPTEAALELRREVDRGDLASVVSRLDAELQAFLEPQTQLVNLMEEGLSL
jgi:hypothetical protein